MAWIAEPSMSLYAARPAASRATDGSQVFAVARRLSRRGTDARRCTCEPCHHPRAASRTSRIGMEVNDERAQTAVERQRLVATRV